MEPSPLNFAKSTRSISTPSFPEIRGFADMSLSIARRLAGVAIVAVAVGACSPQSSVAAAQGESPAPALAAGQPTSPQPVGTLNGRILPDFATLVEQVGPAVVNVSVLEKPQRVLKRGGGQPDSQDDPMQEFFKRFGIPAPDQRGEVPQR